MALGEFQQGPGIRVYLCPPPPQPTQWTPHTDSCSLTPALSPGPAQAPLPPDGRPGLSLQVGLRDVPPRQLLLKGLPCVRACASATSNVARSPFS